VLAGDAVDNELTRRSASPQGAFEHFCDNLIDFGAPTKSDKTQVSIGLCLNIEFDRTSVPPSDRVARIPLLSTF